MAQWCDSCGQKLPEGPAPENATWLGTPDDDHVHTFSRPGGEKKSGRDKKLLIVAGAAVLVWGAFVGLGRIVTPDDAIDEQAAADIEEARAEREAADAANAAEDSLAPEIAEVDGDYGPADAAPGFPEVDSGDLDSVGTRDGDALVADAAASVSRRPSVQVERLQRQLNRRESTAMAAYVAADGVVVIDLAQGTAQVIAPEPATSALRGSPLLRQGATTFAIGLASPNVSQIVADSSLVVADARDGNTYFVDAQSLSGQASIVEVVSDGVYSFHRMPAGGFQLQAVDGLGLLAVPKGPTGETLIAGVDAFSTLSQHRVLTGTAEALLLQQCSSESECALVIEDLDTGAESVVPSSFVRFGDRYSLAPDGSALLRYSPEGFSEVFVTGGDSIAWVIGAGMRAPAWSPDSDFIAWIDRLGEPKLKVMFPDERDWLTIDLRDLGAPPPTGPELVVFNPAEVATSAVPRGS